MVCQEGKATRFAIREWGDTNTRMAAGAFGYSWGKLYLFS